MHIYTSYFANKQAWNNPNAYSIAKYSPRGWTGKSLANYFAPTAKILSNYKNNFITEQGYTEAFQIDVLDNINKEALKKVLHDGMVLICYEKPGAFCHRHLVAKWLSENYDVEVTEL